MSTKKPAAGRQLLTGIDTSGAFPVEYRFAHAKGGNRHLVVVFANFAVPQDYGWSNGVFDNIRANILWIRDRFDGMNSYYLCKGMDFSLESSVAGLIFNVMKALDLTPDDVTMWGGSKGGSAALYYGMRYGFRNIVSIVPQFLIGTYVQTIHPKVADFMLGEGAPLQNVRAVDALLPDLVRARTNPRANIYLLSSPQDEQFPTQVEPFLGLFQGYENFNFIFSESPFITDHALVTRRNVPALLGIMNLLADGIAPRFGHVRNGYEQPDRDRSAIDSYLKATSVVRGVDFPAPVVTSPAAHQEVPRNAVRFSGTAAGAARVVVWEHGKYLGQTDVAADGTWSWELGRSWSRGKHAAKVYAVSAEGFQSARVEVAFVGGDETAGAGPVSGPGAQAVPGMLMGSGGASAGPAVLTPAAYEQVAGPGVVFTGVAPGTVQVLFREQGQMLGAVAVGQDGRWSWDAGWAWAAGTHEVDVVGLDAFGGEIPVGRVPFAVTGASVGAPTNGYFGGAF
ncbi:hypothetical protein [Streptomyces sp. VRA16 Mangrove soil]|uniref:hypothetical protein n=1 Tax=Streptomyces sp. VRA16 Mangrove soil TaxID=2817434 RepID=UPI001AA00928|nr:hypothetical protein [Streptomyces sp. VRA16 Mangrove soil]MBO1335584.1 hypothetical protein [Streptomyces sp. VRA16 Mangrove soil]